MIFDASCGNCAPQMRHAGLHTAGITPCIIPAQTARLFFLRSGTDVYGMRHANRRANACRIITVQKESFAPGSNTLHHTPRRLHAKGITVCKTLPQFRMPRVSCGISGSAVTREGGTAPNGMLPTGKAALRQTACSTNDRAVQDQNGTMHRRTGQLFCG